MISTIYNIFVKDIYIYVLICISCMACLSVVLRCGPQSLTHAETLTGCPGDSRPAISADIRCKSTGRAEATGPACVPGIHLAPNHMPYMLCECQTRLKISYKEVNMLGLSHQLTYIRSGRIRFGPS